MDPDVGFSSYVRGNKNKNKICWLPDVGGDKNKIYCLYQNIALGSYHFLPGKGTPSYICPSILI